MTYFVETDQFNQMLSYNPYVTTGREKKKIKYSLLDRIQEVLGDKWNRLKEGTRQAFDMICFLGTELGFVYAGDEYLAERHDISDRTVRNRLKELEELGQVIKVHRRAKRCNGRGKPIYLFVNHPYFNDWVRLLGINLEDFHTDFQTENDEIPCESKVEGTKKVSTYSLPKKQEKDINISNNTIIQYVINRVNDSIKKGTRITYLSRYVDQIITNMERQAIFAENNRQNANKKQQQEENSRFIQKWLGNKKPEPVPFYNWLEQ